jgi:PKD repeat protein
MTSNQNDSIFVLFSNSGVFTNRLIVSNQYGCADTSFKQLLLYPRPVASATLNPAKGCQPLPVQFTNNSSNANNYLWSFGDGGMSNVQNPLYTYHTDGDYQVRLISYGNASCSDTLILSDTVNVYPKPVASFTYTDINTPVQNSGKIQMINNTILADYYLWDFGDNTTDTLFEPIHRYDMYGTYDIYLYVENTYGCKDTAHSTVRINDFHGLYVSNAFSPDYGPDDVRVFKPRGVALKTYHIYIYDNWGNLIW